jgi:hypothetical protein
MSSSPAPEESVLTAAETAPQSTQAPAKAGKAAAKKGSTAKKGAAKAKTSSRSAKAAASHPTWKEIIIVRRIGTG